MLNAAFVFVYSLPSLIFSNALFFDAYYVRYLFIGLPAAAIGAVYLRSKAGELIRTRSCEPDIPVYLWIFLSYAAFIGALYMTAFADFIDGVFALALMIGIHAFAMHFKIGLKPLLIAANIAGVAHIVIAHMQFYGLSKGLPWIMPVELFKGYSVIGNIGYRGLLGIYISLCGVNSVYLAATAKKTTARAFHIVMLFAFVVSVASIGGRAALIALPVAFIPWGIYYRRQICAFVAKRKRLVAFSLLILAFFFAFSLRDSNIMKRMMMLGRDSSSMLRLSHYVTTIFMIEKAPLLGVGIGNYKYHYLDAQKTMKESFPYATYLPWTYTFWAHNEYLQFAAEFGIPALLALIAIASAWFRNIRNSLKSGKKTTPELCWGISVVSIFLVASLFERPFHQIEVCIWFPLACAIINTHIRKKQHTRMKCVFGLTAMAVILVAGVGIYVDGAFGQHALRRAYDATDMAVTYAYLGKATEPLLTRDETRIYKNALDIAFFSKTNNRRGLDAALDVAYSLFLRYPTSETYAAIRNNAIRYNRVDLYRKLKPIWSEKPAG